MLRIIVAYALLIGPSAAHAAPPTQADASCKLTSSDLTMNASLSYQDFDQTGVSPTTARKLGERGCYTEAARATEDYLAHAPFLTAREIRNLTWHLGQYLASAGDQKTAAPLLIAARAPSDEPPQPDGFDWNTYVLGTWAFLVKDREELTAALSRLSKAPGERNAMNAKVLARFVKCFDHSYLDAYDSDTCAAGE